MFRRPSAWLYTLIVLNLPLSTEGPFVGLFASVMILIAFCWYMGKRFSYAESLFLCTVLSFLVTFARPEYNDGTLLCALATVIAVAIERVRLRRGDVSASPPSKLPAWLMLGIAAVLGVAVVHLLHVAPTFRAGMAFAQHFNIRSSKLGLIPEGPDNWRSNYAELRFGVDAGKNALTGTATIGEFFRANPRLFVGQVANNCKDPRAYLLVLGVLAVIALPWLRRDWTSLRPASVALLLLCIPALSGSVIIYPHTHYGAVILPAVTVFLLQILDPERWIPVVVWPLVAGLGLALMVYLYILRPPDWGVPVRIERLNELRVRCVQQRARQDTRGSAKAFSAVEAEPFLIDPGRALTYPRDIATWSSFQNWVEHNDPAWVAVDDDRAVAYATPPVALRYGVQPAAVEAFLKSQGFAVHPCEDAAEMTMYTHN